MHIGECTPSNPLFPRLEASSTNAYRALRVSDLMSWCTFQDERNEVLFLRNNASFVSWSRTSLLMQHQTRFLGRLNATSNRIVLPIDCWRTFSCVIFDSIDCSRLHASQLFRFLVDTILPLNSPALSECTTKRHYRFHFEQSSLSDILWINK